MTSDYETILIRGRAKLSKVKDPHWLIKDLPWRKNRTSYRTFLAEFLLVRTRYDVVARLFNNIISNFPDISSLVNAEEKVLNNLLKPLGLKKRVPLLISAAKYIKENYDGKIPDDFDNLLDIPGIGVYTASAIRAFAFGKKDVPADVNVFRFISRLTGLPMEHSTKGSAEIRDLLPLFSEELGGPKAESLLDFSSQICKSRIPKCEECLLAEYCSYWAKLSSS